MRLDVMLRQCYW